MDSILHTDESDPPSLAFSLITLIPLLPLTATRCNARIIDYSCRLGSSGHAQPAAQPTLMIGDRLVLHTRACHCTGLFHALYYLFYILYTDTESIVLFCNVCRRCTQAINDTSSWLHISKKNLKKFDTANPTIFKLLINR